MQRAKSIEKSAQNGPPVSDVTPGVKYCLLCKNLVHPTSQFTECKMEFCSDRARVHKKCIAYRLENGAQEVTVTCPNCKMISSWRPRPWIRFFQAGPESIFWILYWCFLPMTLVKMGGWGESNKWDFSQQKVVIPHILTSLLVFGVWRIMKFIGTRSSDMTRWFWRKCCCCCAGCCRRSRYDDFE